MTLKVSLRHLRRTSMSLFLYFKAICFNISPSHILDGGKTMFGISFSFPTDQLRFLMEMDSIGYGYCPYCKKFHKKVEGTNYISPHMVWRWLWRERCLGSNMPMQGDHISKVLEEWREK